MTHWRKIVSKDSPHLNVWDIEGRSPVVVTISGHAIEAVHNDDGSAKDMLFLTFKGAKKALGINVTNATLIAATLGTPNVEEWHGKQITLRTATCRGEDCVRVGVSGKVTMPKRMPKFRYTDTEGKGGKAAGKPVDDVPPDTEPPHDGDDLPFNE